jgi:hypothetical protein
MEGHVAAYNTARASEIPLPNACGGSLPLFVGHQVLAIPVDPLFSSGGGAAGGAAAGGAAAGGAVGGASAAASTPIYIDSDTDTDTGDKDVP